jgi:RNA polymerase sigma-70 factor (ECF subfamily)
MAEMKIPQKPPGPRTDCAALLSEVFVNYLQKEARFRAASLVRCELYPPSEQEDVGQDLLLDVLRRLPRYNDALGSPFAFASSVIRNQARELAGRRSTWSGRDAIPLDTMRWGDQSAPIFPARFREPRLEDFVRTSDLKIDVGRVVDRLPKNLKHVAQDLKSMTVGEACLRSGKSRSRIYEIIGEIRGSFIQAGFSGVRHTKSARERSKAKKVDL